MKTILKKVLLPIKNMRTNEEFHRLFSLRKSVLAYDQFYMNYVYELIRNNEMTESEFEEYIHQVKLDTIMIVKTTSFKR